MKEIYYIHTFKSVNFFIIERETRCYVFMRQLTTNRENVNVAISIVSPGETDKPTDKIVKFNKNRAPGLYTGELLWIDSGYQIWNEEDHRLHKEFRNMLNRDKKLEKLLG